MKSALTDWCYAFSQTVAHTKVTSITEILKPSSTWSQCHSALVVIHGTDLGHKFDLAQPEISIGRSSEADIHLDQESVSRNHAVLNLTGSDVFVRDLGSTNGTFVNDEQVRAELKLQHGDLVKVGRTIFRFISGNNVEAAYHDEIYRLTTIDGLTQIYNRRHFEETLRREFSRARRYGRILSLILFDIDGFKQVNDTFGHLAGDFILRQMAARIHTKVRREDLFARYGGEEFVLLLPEVGAEGAVALAEKIRKLAEKTRFEFGKNTLSVTLSLGVCTLEQKHESVDQLLAEVDGRLYEAKRSGRNRVCG